MKIEPIAPGITDAVHLAYRGDTAGICGRSTGVLTSDPGDYDCPDCDAAYVTGVLNADSEDSAEQQLPSVRVRVVVDLPAEVEPVESMRQVEVWYMVPVDPRRKRPIVLDISRATRAAEEQITAMLYERLAGSVDG